MAECPVCFGEGQHDHTDFDAEIGEQFSDAEIERLRERVGLVHPAGIVECDECEGTGVVSETRAKEIRAAAVASIDQALAKVLAEERQLEGGV